MQYLLYILAIPFLYLNYKIVTSDLKNKIIPNKYLIYLLLLIPFYYIYVFFIFPEINYIIFLGQIIITFIVSFILYYFGIWAAGDAKYLLVLNLFIPYIGIVSFIGNIALITIFYLLLYFIYFYLGKILLKPKWRKSLVIQIKTDLKEKWEIYKENKGGKTFFIVFKWIVVFLIIFVSIRLSRLYLINNILEGSNSKGNIFQEFILKYNIYLIFLGFGIFIGFLYLFRLGINKIKIFIGKKLNLNLILVGNIFVSILFILLTSFIVYEYIIEPSEIIHLLFKIFTLYLGLYLIFKMLFYSYKITFGVAEIDYIDIKDLKKGDIVDKEYLVKMFGTQVILGADGKKQNKKGLLYPDPEKKIKDLDNPIDKEGLNLINNIYKEVNLYHKKQNPNHNENNTIKILNTFSFAPYLLFGFVLTFIYKNEIFKYIMNFIIEIIKKLVSGG